MSGHSKWSKIKRKKGASDEKRGKIFSKLSKEISVAARQGADPDFNFQLRLAIDRAKAENMPKGNIDKAIQRGAKAGEGGELKELLYEGFGPGGIAIIIVAYSDNPNRTASEVKHILSRNNGNLAGPGSVMWQFEQLGTIRLKSKDDNLELKLIEAGAEDIKTEEGELVVYTKIGDFQKVKEAIDKDGIQVESAAIEYVAKEEKGLNPEDENKLERLMEALDESDDISEVFTNIK